MTNVIQPFDSKGREKNGNPICSLITKTIIKSLTLHLTAKICFPLMAEAVYLLER